MAEIGEKQLNPLYPVKPAKPPLRREKPKPVGQEQPRQPQKKPQDEDDGKPHIDEYA